MSNFYQKLCDAIGAAFVREQEPMSAHTTFRAGGPARYFVTPEGEKELAAVLAACREAEKAYYILGNGSNLLVSDAGYPGVMILLGSQFTEVVRPESEPGVYELGAGVLLSRAAREAQKDGMTGFEFAAGIPGTVGGAAVMNAGAYGGELKDVLESVRVMTPESTLYPVLRRLQKDDCLETYDRAIDGRNRRYYKITEAGRIQLNLYRGEWNVYAGKISEILKEG